MRRAISDAFRLVRVGASWEDTAEDEGVMMVCPFHDCSGEQGSSSRFRAIRGKPGHRRVKWPQDVTARMIRMPYAACEKAQRVATEAGDMATNGFGFGPRAWARCGALLSASLPGWGRTGRSRLR